MHVRKKQCKACPWRKDVTPNQDIPNGYCRKKHAKLKSTIAREGEIHLGSLRMMACHESNPGKEYPCVGWLVNQLGPGNNIGLRMLAFTDPQKKFANLEVIGDQHDTFEETLECE